MQAIILAAGFGSRLRPLTDHTPKALIECAGKPMLLWVLEYLKSFKINHVVINTHYLADQIVDFLHKNTPSGLNVEISDEQPLIKETGGALVQALPLFSPNEPILIYNTDVLSNLNLSALFNYHHTHQNAATLIVQNRTSNRKLIFDETMRLVGWKNQETGEKIGNTNFSYDALAFSGIHIIEPSMVSKMAEIYSNQPFPVIPAYLTLIDQYKIGGFIPPQDTFWLEIGSPERLAKAEEWLLTQGK